MTPEQQCQIIRAQQAAQQMAASGMQTPEIKAELLNQGFAAAAVEAVKW